MKPFSPTLRALPKALAIAATAFALSACSNQTTDSDEIQTETIWANIKIASDGERSRISTELNVSGPGGNNLNLTSGDKLMVYADGITAELEKDFDFFDIDYQGYINVTGSNELFTIALERPNDENAPNSKVHLPEAFDIQQPQANQLFVSNENINLKWDGRSGSQSIYTELRSQCKTITGSDLLQVADLTIEDDGQHTIVLEDLEMFQNNNLDKSKICTFEVYMQRKTFGNVDPLFKNNSKISATQYRKVENVKIDLL